ncbi:MAG: efflux RND transporter periplasmic adaptor subunit [Opitutaceae bacterium]|nr:efflux RND transporter periplasmic adaptor subunit [Opitutaceae bacterium]
MKHSHQPRLSAPSLFAALSFLAGIGHTTAANPAQPEPPAVPVVRAEAQTAPDSLPFTGRIEAAQRVELRPRVSGMIAGMHFVEGTRIAAGTKLFTIDPRPYRARREQAAAELARAEAEALLASQELARTRELRASATVSVEELERRTATAAATLGSALAARAVLAAADLDLEFTEVRTPIAGRVGRALLTIGNLAAADATALTTLFSTDAMRVRFAVDEPTFHRLRAAAGSRLGVRITVTGHPGASTANVDYVGNAIDPATGTAEVRATVAGPADHLADGMFARVELQLPAAQTSVLVPETALGAEQGSRYVLVADAAGKIVQRRVTLGQRVGSQRAIMSGVSAGESVVTAGLQFLRPGMTIKPLTTPAAERAQLAPGQE